VAPTLSLVSPQGLHVIASLRDGQPEIAFSTPAGGVTAQAERSAYVVELGRNDMLEIYLPVPAPGQWTAQVGGVTAGADAIVEVRGNLPLPSLAISARPISRHGTKEPVVVVSGSLRGSSVLTSVSLYAGTSPCSTRDNVAGPAVPGLLLSASVPLRHGHFNYTWHTSSAPTGNYTVYAVANNGVGPLLSACSPTRVTVTQPKPIAASGHKANKRNAQSAQAKTGRAPAEEGQPPATRAPGPVLAVPILPGNGTGVPSRAPDGGTGMLPVPTFIVNGFATPKSFPAFPGRSAASTPAIAINDYEGITGMTPLGAAALDYVTTRVPPWGNYLCTQIPNCYELTFIKFTYEYPISLADEEAIEKQVDANRAKACGRDPFLPTHKPGAPDNVLDPVTMKVTKNGEMTSCDEYPFASTTQGGKNAIVAGVTIRENNRQGGMLSRFMQNNALALYENEGKFYVCVQLPAGKPPLAPTPLHAGRC